MLDKNSIKLHIEDYNLPSDVLGIDLGQSLSKMAFYHDDVVSVDLIDTTTGMDEIKNYINSHKSAFKKINLTGGKAYPLFKDFKNFFKIRLINEFEAISEGLGLLYSLQKHQIMPVSIIITVGTGTSITLKRNSLEHIGGTALGGGFFMGFAKFAYNLISYQKAIELAHKGNRYNVDLKVGDIYDKQDERVDRLFREFTAASLGKITANISLNYVNKEDMLSSINAMLAENIGTIATSFADNYNVSTIVFCGGFLIENRNFKQMVSLLCKIKNKQPIFLDYSEFAGAVGALINIQ